MLIAVRLQQSCPIVPSNGGRVHPLAGTDTKIIKTIGSVRLIIHQIIQKNGTCGSFGFSTKMMNNIGDDFWINFRWELPQLFWALALSIQQNDFENERHVGSSIIIIFYEFADNVEKKLTYSLPFSRTWNPSRKSAGLSFTILQKSFNNAEHNCQFIMHFKWKPKNYTMRQQRQT